MSPQPELSTPPPPTAPADRPPGTPRGETTVLTPAARRAGRWRMLLFSALNGLSIACLAETMVSLYAIKLAMPDPWVQAMGAFLYLTMPAMALGRPLIARFGATRAMAGCWVARSLLAMGMAAAPPLVAYGGVTAGWGLVLILSLAFFLCRSMGMLGNLPIMGDISSAAERGRFSGLVSGAFSAFLLLGTAIITLLLRWRDDMPLFQAIIIAGGLANLTAGAIILHVPETDNPRRAARRSVGAALRAVIRRPHYRRLAIGWAAALVLVMLTRPAFPLILKRGYGLSDATVTALGFVQVAGGLCACFLLSRFADRVGPRVATVGLAGCAAAAAAGLCLYDGPPWLGLFGLLAALVGAAMIGTFPAYVHAFLAIVDEEDRVGVGLWCQMIGGLIGGLAGTALGGGLLWGLEAAGYADLPLYRLYFAVVAVLSLPLLLLVASIRTPAPHSPHSTHGLG